MLDGELDAVEMEQAYKILKGDEQQRHAWARYSLISDALKNNLPQHLKHDLADRLSLALENEPNLLVPGVTRKDETVSQPVVDDPIPMTADGSRPFRIPVGLAAVASVALFSIAGVAMFSNSEMLRSIDGGVPVAEVESVGEKASAIASVAPPVQTVTVKVNEDKPHAIAPMLSGNEHWQRLAPVQNIPQLTPYLVEHSEFSSSTSVKQGMFPYARVVSFEENRAK